MKQIIECIANYSEGKNTDVINKIAESIKKTSGCTLLHVDIGWSANRTVISFVGDKKSILQGAINAAQIAFQEIDMRNHKGTHPRIGALDVCPFVPISNATINDCMQVAEEFARIASTTLGVACYMYQFSQEKEYRKELSQIRFGEYEALEKRMILKKWKPDYGKINPENNSMFLPRWGATVTGARNALIAYNVNLLGTKEQAKEIAEIIRESGSKRNENSGLLKNVKAIGWYVNEYNMAQISMNLTDYSITGIHQAYEACVNEANKMKLKIAGSELIGLIPLKAITNAADYYIKKERLEINSIEEKIKLAAHQLGLNSVHPFTATENIIEYAIKLKS